MVSVSIALATYNGEKFVRRQLESLAWQTRVPDELVVTDDCSSDRTVEILHEFARTAPFPVHVHSNASTLNFRANFMKAAALCSCDVILFCDQDDVWREGKVAAMARAFDEDPALTFAYHDAMVVDAEERELYRMFDLAEQRQLLAQDPPPPLFFVRGLVQGFRRELCAFDDLWPATLDHFSNEPLGHDRWYFLLALGLGKVGFLEEDLLMYRQHGGNVAGADPDLSWLGRMIQRWPQDPAGDRSRAAGARSRAGVLRAVAARVPADRRLRLERFARAYDVHAERLERRARTFSEASPFARAGSLLRALASGDYRGGAWRFDPRSMLRDGLMGVAGLGRKSA